MAVVIVSLLCVINIFLWFVFFKKFTKLFSTDDIIENTRSELNKMILDVNRNAERDITIIEDRIRTLKDIIAEADKRVALAQTEIQKRSLENAYRQTIENVSGSTPVNRAAEEYRRNGSSTRDRAFFRPSRGKRTGSSSQAALFGAQSETVPSVVRSGHTASIKTASDVYRHQSRCHEKILMQKCRSGMTVEKLLKKLLSHCHAL